LTGSFASSQTDLSSLILHPLAYTGLA